MQTCEPCNKTIKKSSMKKHLKTKTHLDNVETIRTLPPEVAAWLNEPAAPRITWHCDVCNKDVLAKNESKHIASKSHVMKETAHRARTSQPLRGARSAATLTSSTRRASPASVGSDRDAIVPFTTRWHCDVCDKDFNASRKETHLLTRTHMDNVLLFAEFARARTPRTSRSARFHCNVCDKDLNASSKASHLKSKGHVSKANFGRYQRTSAGIPPPERSDDRAAVAAETCQICLNEPESKQCSTCSKSICGGCFHRVTKCPYCRAPHSGCDRRGAPNGRVEAPRQQPSPDQFIASDELLMLLML
jgi:hypothetical protein